MSFTLSIKAPLDALSIWIHLGSARYWINSLLIDSIIDSIPSRIAQSAQRTKIEILLQEELKDKRSTAHIAAHTLSDTVCATEQARLDQTKKECQTRKCALSPRSLLPKKFWTNRQSAISWVCFVVRLDCPKKKEGTRLRLV